MKLILIAGALALFLSLFGTPALIKVLARRGYGQMIRDDGPSTHHTKRGTPTMGGIIIIFASFVAYLVAHLLTQSSITVSAVLILGLVICLGFVGFLDDYMKVSRQNSRGLSGKQKIFGQVLFASIFGYLGTRFPDKDGLTPISLNLSTVRDTSITLGVVLVVTGRRLGTQSVVRHHHHLIVCVFGTVIDTILNHEESGLKHTARHITCS